MQSVDLMHVSKSWSNMGGVETHQTWCGIEVVKDEETTVLVWWAGWRSTCAGCLVASAPMWQEGLEELMQLCSRVPPPSMASRLAVNLREEWKRAMGERR